MMDVEMCIRTQGPPGHMCVLEQVKRQLKRIHIDGCRCDEGLNTKTEGAKRLAYNG